MSNETLARRIKLLEGSRGATPQSLVSNMLRAGHTSILTDGNGCPIKFADLSDAVQIVVVTACEQFVRNNGHGVTPAPFMERHDNAIQAASSLLGRLEGTGNAGCPLVHRISDDTIKDGLAVFSDLIIAQARVDKPNCFRDADVTGALARLKSHDGAHTTRPGRRGARTPRSLANANAWYY